MTYLAVPIPVTDAESLGPRLEQAVRQGAELIELRLDYLQDPGGDQVRRALQLAKQSQLPVIATCRPQWEGGHYADSERGRKAVFKQAVRAQADYLDIESACREDGEIQLEEILGKKGAAAIIRSNHDFQHMPLDLAQRLQRLTAQGGGVAKIACMIRAITDCFPLLDWMHTQILLGKQVIAIGMGEAGLLTRLAAKKLGAFLTFAAFDEQQATAPGQISLADMKTWYRWDHINSQTRLFGVIGCPIAHSMSPLIHNSAFSAVAYNGLYLPLLVQPDWAEFRGLLDGFRQRPWLDLKGLSVTIPHKEHALRYVESAQGTIEPLAGKIGAVNTIVFDEQGRPSGYNTDYAGALDALLNGGKLAKADLRRLPVAVLGAGGVARAVVAGLTDAGAEVAIINRTAEKARLLADEFHAHAAGWDKIAALGPKIIVNCTSVGMHPHINDSPLDAKVLKRDMIVFDTVYNPLQTKLLQDAAAAGALTVTGLDMFVAQAALQFELFTQLHAPYEVMYKIVKDRLVGIK